MEVIDKRKIDAEGNAKASAEESGYDAFRPTLERCMVQADHILLRVLKLKEDGLIASPDAYAEPTLYGEIIDSDSLNTGLIIRFLQGVGTTVQFSDVPPDQRYLTIHKADVICYWTQ